MNLMAATIASGIGAVFFAGASVFYYQPAFIKPEKVLDAVLSTNQAKARKAVARLLLDPSSAEFDGMRSVQVDTAKFVCGSVRAKDKAGAYAGHRAFVYTVAIDFARIDDDGTIAQRHDAYRACPVTVEDEKVALRKTPIPGGLQTVQRAIPATGGTMQEQLESMGGQSSATLTAVQGSGSLKAASAPSQPASTSQAPAAEWRADRPPAAWPMFPPGHVLSKPTDASSNAEALALATQVEARWQQHRSGASKQRPTVADIQDAQRALMAIGAKSPEFAQAWALFLRLQAMERDGAA